MSSVLNLTSGAFGRVTELTQPVLIDFWAPSADRRPVRRPAPAPRPSRACGSAAEPRCGPCRMQGPILEQVAASLGDKAVVAKVNVDDEPELAARFGVSSIPTLVVMKQGQVLRRLVGVQPAPVLAAALQSAGA